MISHAFLQNVGKVHYKKQVPAQQCFLRQEYHNKNIVFTLLQMPETDLSPAFGEQHKDTEVQDSQHRVGGHQEQRVSLNFMAHWYAYLQPL